MTSSRTAEFVRRLADPDPAVVAQVENPDETTTRILHAALEQAELVGMRRSTMDDVARRSGVGRATLYRRFPSKDALNYAVVLSEVRRFLKGSVQARSRGTTLEDRIVYSTVFTVTFMREHALLKKLLRTEPETILPSLTVDAGPIVDFATDYSAALLREELYGPTTTTPAPNRRRTADPPHTVVHRHPTHQHQALHAPRHPGVRTRLPSADDHGVRLTRVVSQSTLRYQ